jgi:serine protease AprX
MLRRFVFQTFGRARRTQDSPIVPDVWIRYILVAEATARANIAKLEDKPRPETLIDLLLTPWSGSTPGQVAKSLRDRLGTSPQRLKEAGIAQSTSRVVVRVDFQGLVRDVVPLTGWWRRLSAKRKNIDDFQDINGHREFQDVNQYQDYADIFIALQLLRDIPDESMLLSAALADAGNRMGSIRFADFVEFFRYATLVGFIDRLTVATSEKEVTDLARRAQRLGPRTSDEEEARARGEEIKDRREATLGDVRPLLDGFRHALGDLSRVLRRPPPATSETAESVSPIEGPRPEHTRPDEIYLINLNRPAAQSLFESRKTVKADAAHRVFDINTAGITFAVIDGGVDATHPAFLKWGSWPEGKLKPRDYLEDFYKKAEVSGEYKLPAADLKERSRVAATFDFTILRGILASGGNPDLAPTDDIEKILKELAAKNAETKTALEHIGTRSDNARDLDWEMVRLLVEVPHDANYKPPSSDHGTHVAGILAADLRNSSDPDRQEIVGMCPGLSVYDLRVFDAKGVGDEFAILSALEFAGWLNRDRANPVVHGVNLSLALAHDVDSFACGQTPICEVCNHLVGSGTVVVTAAGNTGFDGGLKQSLGTGYRSISITDPGNAEQVITVGSTHRRDPHAYGVSYFSARGPTGDGRRKPDLLAPGEKITSTIRDGRTQRMDGTSMAAPHVSGAAALLMARYPELIGHPLRIKEILMRSATDLNREPSFQGAGLLDVLRALQSI